MFKNIPTIILAENFHTKDWSGGITTELFIFPPTSEYQQMNFNFRLSTATVEVQKSDFTPLPSVARTLLVLDGKISLFHENHHTKILNKFDQDQFQGEWKTSSIGKCIDFNLMTMGETTGVLGSLSIKTEEMAHSPIEEQWDWFFVYVSTGDVSINLSQENYILRENDLFVLNQPIAAMLEIKGLENSELIFCHIVD